MRNIVLLTGAAMAATATPALAGGPLGGGMLTGMLILTLARSTPVPSILTRGFTL